jgi:hypothetical protein
LKTIRDILNAFLEMVAERQGRLSFDKEWSFRLIYFYFKVYRARYLNERRIKKVPHSRQNIQTIPCIKLKKTDMNECPCLPDSECVFLKSSYPVPKSIFGSYISVTSTLGNKTYDYLRWDAFEDRLNSYIKSERIKPYYTLKNLGAETYLYVYSDNKKEVVSATLIAEDPLEVAEFPNCNKKTKLCNPMDYSFPVDNEELSTILDLMFNKLIQVKQTAQPELYNNKEPDTSKKP